MPDFNSPFYPAEKVFPGYNTYRGEEEIPGKILMYLLDLPDQRGYAPVDDNERPRVRLAKYLWHDGAKPLSQAIPTPTQKLSMLFDGEQPVLDTDELKAAHPKGYRLYAQKFWGQSQTGAQTTIKCYMGRTVPRSETLSALAVVFEILCNVNSDTTTRSDAYSRAFAMEQCIVESLNGVSIGGVGVVSFSNREHPDAGSRPFADEGTNVGRILTLSLRWFDDGSKNI